MLDGLFAPLTFSCKAIMNFATQFCVENTMKVKTNKLLISISQFKKYNRVRLMLNHNKTEAAISSLSL